jgi:8-oxo-dGTP pyrophosphatase MutT (NUDIX family)
MCLEPEKFFVGLIDFFSILLPGALLTYVLMNRAGPVVIGSDRYHALAGPEGWSVFLVASYLSGHLMFLLGSWLDEFYDWVRRHTLNTQISTIARRGRVLPLPARAAIWLIFRGERNLAVNRAVAIKQRTLGPLQAANAVNAFQWCKAVLTLENSNSLAVVQRFEADSKFFRSFVIVLLVLVVSWPLQHRWPLSGLAVVLAVLCLALWRYMEQRYKATNHAYWSVIALTARSGAMVFEKERAAVDGLTHAGGVVFRRRRTGAEYLLVEAKRDPSFWVLPKGHIEGKEWPRETAVREVHEETGVWATISEDLGKVSYSVDGSDVTIQFFLMEYAARGLKSDIGREHIWLPVEDAVEKASHCETRELLLRAERRRVSMSVPANPDRDGRGSA